MAMNRGQISSANCGQLHSALTGVLGDPGPEWIGRPASLQRARGGDAAVGVERGVRARWARGKSGFG